ncbi:hypothetical protein B2G71_15485 [Novosphingobium sp. PC22D]|uniref:DUF2889 domain-containing protein n=1 Tax=Novosphingobium sp. PC22D TaxID=1962403 RepID=UPI000BEFCC47|nr:DUF2889 domain-containing protein [Novosphingobium sp. PC22D]PEQ11840.1 hypothetical protein B2G71_15485 [Novosphingobium sp. PC22D]
MNGDGINRPARDADAFALPGYRRAVLVEPEPGRVTALLEDDIHCMAVRLDHARGVVTRARAHADRMPWTTCPGAVAKLRETFEGAALSEVTARRDKKANCTHLHDMAVLAAAHAGDAAPLAFAIAASDPRDGVRILEIRRGGRAVHRWIERDGQLVAPPPLAGSSLLTMRDWIASLEGAEQEAARLLQWASLVAHGRTIPAARQSDASAMPPTCYTFQPDRAAHAQRTGVQYDFSTGSRRLLAGLRDRTRAALAGDRVGT